MVVVGVSAVSGDLASNGRDGGAADRWGVPGGISDGRNRCSAKRFLHSGIVSTASH